MIPLIVVYGVLILLVAVLYVVSQRFGKGPRKPFFAWLKSGFVGAPKATGSRPSETMKSPAPLAQNSTDDVVSVLEDLYEDFVGRLDTLRTDNERRFRDMEASFNARIALLEEQLMNAKTPSVMMDEAVQPTLGVRPLPERDNPTLQASMPVEVLEELPTLVEVASTARVEPVAEVPSEITAPKVPDIAQPAARAAVASEPRRRPSSNMLHFEILDELHAGKSPDQIAKSLRIPLEEVENVLRIMQTP